EQLEEHGRVLSTLVRLTDQFGVSYETLIYRLHHLRLIDAEGHDRLAAISWQRIVDRSVQTLRDRGYAQPQIGRLFTRGQLKPASRPPSLLVRRAFEGYRKGVLSIRPLAGLLHEDPDELRSKLTTDGELLAELDDLDS